MEPRRKYFAYLIPILVFSVENQQEVNFIVMHINPRKDNKFFLINQIFWIFSPYFKAKKR